MTSSQLYKQAYQHGILAKQNGWENKSQYSGIASRYWLAGYHGVKITNFTTWHKHSPKQLLKADQYDTIISILKPINGEELNELKMRVEWNRVRKGRNEKDVWVEEINKIIQQ